MKRNNNKRIAWLIIFIVIILFLVLYLKERGSFTYKGKNGEYFFTVEKIGDIKIYRPHVNYNDKEIVYAFRNKPQSLERLYMDTDIVSNLNRLEGLEEVYITKDINLSELTDNSVSLVTGPMASVLGKTEFGMYKIGVRVAFTEYHAGQPTAYIVDCSTMTREDISRDSAIILLKLGEENKVYSDGNGCITIEGKNKDGLIKAGEKFAYSLIGVF